MSETIAEDVHVEETLVYPFRYQEKWPTLQEMASYRFCQKIWHANIKPDGTSWLAKAYDDPELKRRHQRVDALVEALNLPKPIAEMLKQGAKKTYDELKRWTENMRSIASSVNEIHSLAVDIDWCVWLPGGELDCRRSAANALNSDDLSETMKFAISMKFCFEDELKKISSRPLLQAVEHLQYAGQHLDTQGLAFYWISYLNNTLERVPMPSGSTWEKIMANACYLRNESYAFEYFWRRLGNNDQISLCDDFFRLPFQQRWGINRWIFLEPLLCTISSSSSESLTAISIKYLRNSMIQSRLSHHQLPMWHRLRDQIADREFADLIHDVFKHAIGSEDRTRMLIGVWDAAHDRQRQYVADHKTEIIMGYFTRYADQISDARSRRTNLPCSAAIDLMWQVILLNTVSERSRLITKHINGLVCTTKLLASLRAMLHSCLPSTDEQSHIRNILPRSAKLQKTCVAFLGQRRYIDLNAILEWMFSDSGPNAVNDYKKAILTCVTWKYASSIQTFLSSMAKWNELSQFIDETYAGDERSAYEMKRMLVEEATSARRYGRYFRKHFDILRQIVEQVLPAHDLTYFKRIRLYGLGEQLRNGVFWSCEQSGDEKFLQNFVEWCCDHDEESISKFKKAIPFGVVLTRIVSEVMYSRLEHEVNLEALLHRLDAYLKWLVGSDEKVRECKLQAIEHCTIEAEMLKDEMAWMFSPIPVPLPSYINKALRVGMRESSPDSIEVTPEDEAQRARLILLNWLCDRDQAAVRRLEREISEARAPDDFFLYEFY